MEISHSFPFSPPTHGSTARPSRLRLERIVTGKELTVPKMIRFKSDIPYPALSHHKLLITFILTEEWFTFIGSDSKPANIRFATILNVIPSELVRAANMRSFFEAVQTKMEEPFEELLDRVQIEAPVAVVIAEVFLKWAVDVGNRRNILVALLWPMSAAAFSIFYHFDLIFQNGDLPYE